ncbi:MAG: hypothetical protein DCC65_11870 [Planctomycetota bacterium]|nr:MAG: hypothetical protein DCC65_11870 [Planctomycetota bacterium]
MADSPQELTRINWSECFRFVRVFRSFRYALQPVALMLTVLAVIKTYIVGRILDFFWPDASLPAIGGGMNELSVFITNGGNAAATLEWAKALGDPARLDHAGVFALLMNHLMVSANQVISAVLGASPTAVFAAIVHAVMGLVWLVVMHPLYAILFGACCLAIWSYLGGAVCRATAMLAARDERITLGEATSFARARLWSFFCAPLLPLALILVAGIVLTACGLVGKVPLLGDILVGLLFFIAIGIGLAIAFFVVVFTAGVGMCFPTIAVEGSDAFDALSRTATYLFGRPWKSLLYYAGAIVHGAICITFVKIFARIVFWAVGVFGGVTLNWARAYVPTGERPGMFESIWQPPSLSADTPFYGVFDDTELSHVSAVARFLIRCWVYGMWAVVAAIAINYYFAANTIIYLLLRREVDMTDLEDVHLDEPPEGPAQPPAPTGASGASSGTSLPVIG